MSISPVRYGPSSNPGLERKSGEATQSVLRRLRPDASTQAGHATALTRRARKVLAPQPGSLSPKAEAQTRDRTAAIEATIKANLGGARAPSPHAVEELSARITTECSSLTQEQCTQAWRLLLRALGQEQVKPQLLRALLKPLLDPRRMESVCGQKILGALCEELGGPLMKQAHRDAITAQSLQALDAFNARHADQVAERDVRLEHLLELLRVHANPDRHAPVYWDGLLQCLQDPAFALRHATREQAWRHVLTNALPKYPSPREWLDQALPLLPAGARPPAIESALLHPLARRIAAMSDRTAAAEAQRCVASRVLAWAASQSAATSGRVFSGLACAVAEPRELRPLLQSLARAPASLGEAHVQEIARQLATVAFGRRSERQEARVIATCFGVLTAEASGLTPARVAALARGFFGALAGPTLWACGALLLARCARGIEAPALLEALGRAFVDSLPRPLQASALKPVITRVRKEVPHRATQAMRICEAMERDLDNVGMSQAVPDLGEALLAVGQPDGPRSLVGTVDLGKGPQLFFTLRFSRDLKPDEVSALTLLMRRVVAISKGQAPETVLVQEKLLDALFRPAVTYLEEAFGPIFRDLLRAVPEKDMDEALLTLILDRLFEQGARLSERTRGEGMGLLAQYLGGHGMDHWQLLAILDRGLASMGLPGDSRSLRKQAAWWLAPLLQQDGDSDEMLPTLCFALNHILTSDSRLARPRTQALLAATCAAVTGGWGYSSAGTIFHWASHALHDLASLDLRNLTGITIFDALLGRIPPDPGFTKEASRAVLAKR